MNGVLIRKLWRDTRLPLLIVGVLLFFFQLLWAVVTKNVTTDVLAIFQQFQISINDFSLAMFEQGPAKIVGTLIGGKLVRMDYAQDMLSIAYVHPLPQTILCIWAVGRASAAIAGEIDRGTMELLMAQPITRTQVVWSHVLIDVITIPVLCLATWLGTCAGCWLVGLVGNPEPRFQVDLWLFLPAVTYFGALAFAVSGYSLWLSSMGRSRGKVLGIAILITLVQFLINLIGQLWPPAEPLRPFTVFYYYQPQPLILEPDKTHDWSSLLTLGVVGVVGYLLAWWSFCRRDLPAPL